MESNAELTSRVKALAKAEGFARVGIASAAAIDDGGRFASWIDRGSHADMDYMARNVDKRMCPELLVPGARSVICLLVPYGSEKPAAITCGEVARYARGRDYHKVLKRRCQRLMSCIAAESDGFKGRAFVDSAPVMERGLAAAAGLGWIGRNGCLIAGELGSYVFLCEIICNLPLVFDEPMDAQCGDCRACIDVCPTGALGEDGLVDCRKCLSYMSIEHRGSLSAECMEKQGTRLFGCDSCQEACPHNTAGTDGDVELAMEGGILGGADLADILGWDQDAWDASTRGSAIRRAKFEGLRRNAAVVAGNCRRRELLEQLQILVQRGGDSADAAGWAISRIDIGQD